MTKPFHQLTDDLITTTLDGPGVVSNTLRRQVADYASAPKVRSNEIPPILQAYLTKIALHSYRVTDADVAQLKAAGFSEDELYELTVCAALGAGLARLNHGLALLNC